MKEELEAAIRGSAELEPLGDRVLCVTEELQQQQEGMIHVPDTARETPCTARVLAVGPEVERLEKGQLVLHNQYAGTEITIGREDYMLIREPDVLGVFTSEGGAV